MVCFRNRNVGVFQRVGIWPILCANCISHLEIVNVCHVGILTEEKFPAMQARRNCLALKTADSNRRRRRREIAGVATGDHDRKLWTKIGSEIEMHCDARVQRNEFAGRLRSSHGCELRCVVGRSQRRP